MVGNGINFATLDMLTGAVLMLGYMNRDAIVQTRARRRVVFFSRAKGRLWEKGETSGHSLELAAHDDARASCGRRE